MNKNEMVHLERKEHWRSLIQQCEASGQTQQDWCKEHRVCSASLSRWRTQIWREEEAEKEFAAAREERCFVEMTSEMNQDKEEVKELTVTRKSEKRVCTRPSRQPCQEVAEPRLAKPDAIIGYREYMVGVYEHTSNQVLQKVMEVLKYA